MHSGLTPVPTPLRDIDGELTVFFEQTICFPFVELKKITVPELDAGESSQEDMPTMPDAPETPDIFAELVGLLVLMNCDYLLTLCI